MIWLLLLIPAAIMLYNRWSWIHSYWEFKGVPGPKPLPFVGNTLGHFLGRKTVGELCSGWSEEFRQKPLVGFYSLMWPHLMVQKPDYVETVLVKQFTLFTDRDAPRDKKGNSSDGFLFSASGNEWKAMRTKLAPVFSSEKVKVMTESMENCFDRVMDKIQAGGSREIEHSKLIHSYVIEVTASVVFGMEPEQLFDSSSEFHKNCRSIIDVTAKRYLCYVLSAAFPKLWNLLDIPPIPSKLMTYFRRLMEKTTSQRKSRPVERNDILQLLMELKEKGELEVESWVEADRYLKPADSDKTLHSLAITDEFLTRQAMFFLTTGFDAISSTLTMTLVELTRDEEAMEKVVQELDRVMRSHDRLSYEAVADMKYLDMCLMESMRLHPSVDAITRKCIRNYTFDNGTQVEKGTTVVIPVSAMHKDPGVFADPNRFRPERFSTRPEPGTYLPFGDGPRTCVAKTFSTLQMKIMLARLLHKYRVRLSARTELPVQTSKLHDVALKITSPVYFDLRKRI